MRTIVSGRSDILKLWGTHSGQKTPLRRMRYTVCSECDEGLLVHNVITGELILLQGREMKAMQDDFVLPDESSAELTAHHFLVPADYDEKKTVDTLRSIIRRLQSGKDITSFTILPTTGCNARCFYCYESDFPHVTMSAETADRVIEYIFNHCGEEKKVSLHWFGGEPMLAGERIEQICSGLQRLGVSYKSRMTSNASLFSEDIAEHARHHWHLHEIQITLDGTEKTYCQAKSYVGFRGNPYRTVLDNIRLLLDQKVHVIIRMNLGLHNLTVMQDLVQEIKTLFGNYGNLTVYVGILFNNTGFEKVQYSDDDIIALETARENLEREIADAGIGHGKDIHLPGLKTFHCMADNFQTVLISPTGAIGKCEHAVFDRLIGSIESDLFDEEQAKDWRKIHQWAECEECCLYPDCVMLENCETLKPCIGIALEYRISEVKKRMQKKYQVSTGMQTVEF